MAKKAPAGDHAAMKIVLAAALLMPWLLAGAAPCEDPRAVTTTPVVAFSIADNGQVGPLLATQIL